MEANLVQRNDPNIGIEITEQRLERKIFAQPLVHGQANRITDRGMPYLNIGAIGFKPTAKA